MYYQEGHEFTAQPNAFEYKVFPRLQLIIHQTKSNHAPFELKVGNPCSCKVWKKNQNNISIVQSSPIAPKLCW